MLPEGAVGMGFCRALGGSPPGWADLYGPKDVRGYADCPLGGPAFDLRAENAKFATSIIENFRGFCVSLWVHLKGQESHKNAIFSCNRKVTFHTVATEK